VSPSTVSDYLGREKREALTWEQARELSDAEVEARLLQDHLAKGNDVEVARSIVAGRRGIVVRLTPSIAVVAVITVFRAMLSRESARDASLSARAAGTQA
jgi:hypothetical protein